MLEASFRNIANAPNRLAATAYDKAVQDFLRHNSGVLDGLAKAIAAAPDFAAAHAMWGFIHVLLARRETMQVARQTSVRLQEILGLKSGTALEHAMAKALDSACTGQWRKAADILEAALDKVHPDALLVKVAHNLRFMAGDVAGLLTLTEPFARADGDNSGLGFILGCHAFALEENGRLDEAEAMAQRALHLEPDDIWAMHALAHVYDVSNRTGEGLLWVESGRQQWSGCNNFASHMCWHLALFCLDRGKFDRALAIYDDDLRATLTDDFRDFANAVSFLLRLQQMGVGIGSRFEVLCELARERVADATYVFASLHNLMAFLACKDFKNAEALVTAMKVAAGQADSEQAIVALQSGIPLAQAFMGSVQGNGSIAGLAELAARLPAIGGSAVQRDVFLREMIVMADNVCDHKTTSSLLSVREAMRQADSFTRMIDERMCFGGMAGSSKGAV